MMEDMMYKENEVESFIAQNTDTDLVRFYTGTALYIKYGCKGTCTVNVSRNRKYVVDCKDDMFHVTDDKGYQVFDILADNFKKFVGYLRGYRKASMESNVRKLDYYKISMIESVC